LIGEELQGMDEFIFVDTASGTNVSLNTIGATILELCDGQHTADDITSLIVETTGGAPEQVAADVRDILQEFAAYGLFEE